MPESLFNYLWLIIWILIVSAGILCFLYPLLEPRSEEARESKASS